MNLDPITPLKLPCSSAGGQPAGLRPGASFKGVLEAALRDPGMPPPVPASDVSAAQALELQAALYRHAERLELISKVIDHGVGAVKTILQTRV